MDSRTVAEISENVRELIRRRVTSMDHVEVLMRLFEANGEPMSATELERGARLGPQTVERCAQDLVNARLVTHDVAANAYRYSPPNIDRPIVEELSALYHQRPVTLVKMVYAQPPSPVKSFADAFRLRDEDKTGGGQT